MTALLAFALPLILCAALMPLACRLAVHAGFVDEPGGRKQHEAPVPPIGGLVVFPVFMTCAQALGFDWGTYWPLYLGITVLLVAGALDDYRHINAWAKFGLQILAACIVVLLGDVRLYHLGNLFGFGDMGLDFMSIPFSIVAVTLLINAINLMDGLDGLAGGKGFVVLVWLFIAALFAGDSGAMISVLPVMGALAGFLIYNLRTPLRKRASVFMGDAGSMSLGLLLGWYTIGFVQDPAPLLTPISVAWILALPIIDACGQFYRRVRNGRHPFAPDRGHFHHHFVHAGVPVGTSTALILGVGFVLGGVGYSGVWLGVPEYILSYIWIALLFGHMAASYDTKRYIRFLEIIAGRNKEAQK